MSGDKQSTGWFRWASLYFRWGFYLFGVAAFVLGVIAFQQAPAITQEIAGALFMILGALCIGMAQIAEHVIHGAAEISAAIASTGPTRCSSCGASIRAGAGFCTQCGQKQ